MAKLLVVNNPTYAVQLTVREALNKFSSLTPNEQERVLSEVRKATNLDTLITIPCAGQHSADALVHQFSNEWTTLVPSFTEWGTKYTVSGVGNTATACTCPNFDPDKGNNPRCKHITAVNNSPSRYVKQYS